MFNSHTRPRGSAARAIRVGLVAVAATVVPLVLMSPASSGADALTAGRWGFFPAQTYSDATSTVTEDVYQTAVRAPINADGTSTFAAKRGVIPVQFDLLAGTNTTTTTTRNYGPPVWESIWSNNVDGDDSTKVDDASGAVFTPTSSALTFADITNLSATYEFTQGDCWGGSLRWTIAFQSHTVHVYYGDPNGVQSCSGAASGSGQNLMTTGATNRYEIVGAGAPVYTTKENASTAVGNDTVKYVLLVLDSGWRGDQKANVSGVMVNDNLFVPKTSEIISTDTTPGTMTKTCELPLATLQWAKDDGTAAATVNEAVSVQPKDTNGVFRQVDCKYIYNLEVSSLSGTGTYYVYANIDGVNVCAPARFDLK